MNQVKVGNTTIEIKTPDDNKKLLRSGKYKLRCLLYGKSGTGKSSMASTFPGVKGIIDTDNGGKVYKGQSLIAEIPEDSTLDKLSKKPGAGSAPVAWDAAMAVMDAFIDNPEVTCIVIDSFTSLADACMKKVMSEVNRVGQPATFVEWSRQMDLLKEFLFKAFGSGKDVISIFHEDVEKDEMTGQIWYQPLITGKMAKKVPGYHDEVYHMEPEEKMVGTTKSIKYMVRTSASRLYVAKSRLASLVAIPIMMEADFMKLKGLVDHMVVDTMVATGEKVTSMGPLGAKA